MAYIFVRVSLFCLGLCVGTWVIAWGIEKLGVRSDGNLIGFIFTLFFVIGVASALVGMLLSL